MQNCVLCSIFVTTENVLNRKRFDHFQVVTIQEQSANEYVYNKNKKIRKRAIIKTFGTIIVKRL